METEFALEIKHLDLRLRGRVILEDIELSVYQGEYLAVVGPNGAGKTSLLRCLTHVLSGWSGWVKVLGEDVRALPQKDLARLLSYVPQPGGRISPYTVRQLLLMSRYPHLNPFTTVTQADHDVVMEALAQTGTGPLAERTLGTLSGGERQKVMLAAALVQQAPALLLDEPATFLDPRHEADIRAILMGVNADGRTVVEVTHDLNAAAMYADRVLALKNGRVAYFGEPHGFMDETVLEAIFEHRFLLAPHPQSGQPMILPQAEFDYGGAG